MYVVFAYVHSVKLYGAAVRIIETHKKVQYCRFSRSGQTYECGDMSAADIHVYVMESLCSVRVCKVNAGNFKMAFNLFRAIGSSLFLFFICVEDVKESFCIDQGVVHLVEDAVKLGDRSSHIGEKHHMIHDLTYGHPGVFDQDEICCQYDDQYGSDLADKTFHSLEIE